MFTVSLSPFPYDVTAEAVQTVTNLVQNNGNLYTVQLDNGVPWTESLGSLPFSADEMDQWQRHKNAIGPNQQVYLAIAPLAEDRTSWAPSFDGSPAPSWVGDDTTITDQGKTAYANYVLRAIDYFKPNFLNLGVEAGDMAAKKPAKWPVFEQLFLSASQAVRIRYPSIKVGISFGLAFLMQFGVLTRVQNVLTLSDYAGLSFYPYLSDFYQVQGASALPAPPEQWKSPLGWVKQNVQIPLAMCETAYSSQPVILSNYGLNMAGSETLQSDYVSDLSEIAFRDAYLFTMFFLTVDYDALMPTFPPGSDAAVLWEHTGFFDKNLRAKPAWTTYQQRWLIPQPAMLPPRNLRFGN